MRVYIERQQSGADSHTPIWQVLLTVAGPNQALEPTPSSVRSCLALASGRGLPRAFGCHHPLNLLIAKTVRAAVIQYGQEVDYEHPIT
jgi:hypothetical protein